MAKIKGSGSPKISRGYNLVLERNGIKIGISATQCLFGGSMRSAPGTQKNRLGLSDEELQELEENIFKKEGTKNLINTSHSEAIAGNRSNLKSLPKVKSEYLEGVVKSKKRGWHDVTLKRPFISEEGDLLLNDVNCSCGDAVHTTKKGGEWSYNVVCMHASSLWDDLAEYLAKREYGNENLYGKKGWILEEDLENDLFVPFTFMEYDERGESPQADRLMRYVMEKRYNNGEKLYDIDRKLLKKSTIFTDELEDLIEDGDIGFEFIQQDVKKEDEKNDYVREKAKMSQILDANLKKLNFRRSGKCLEEEGLPADRYEHEEKDLAINVVYSEEFPPFLAVKKLKDEIKIDGNNSNIKPYEYMGATLERRVDDKTRRVADVRYSTPNKILWPNISKSKGNDIEVPPIIEEMSRDAIEKYAKFPEYSLRETGLA